MQNEKTNPSKNIPKDYKPSKFYLIGFYLFFILPLILIPPYIYFFGALFPFCGNFQEIPYSCDNSIDPLLSLVLFFIFGLILRKVFLNIKNNKSLSRKQVMHKVFLWAFISIFFFFSFFVLWMKVYIFPAVLYNATGKPVIYLYPEKTMDVKVKLDFKGTVKATYPDYDYSMKGWEVEARPDGQLINKKDNQEYSYLFWDGDITNGLPLDMRNGFVVKGSDTKIFLQKTLKQIGLTPKEYNEFIVYWYPLMMNNEYNFIHFVGQDYTDIAPLDISPRPDSILRVFMVFKALEKPIDVKPQIFEPFERKGFTVVEWGGIESK